MRFDRLSSREYFATLDNEAELAANIWDKIADFYVRMRGRLYYQRALESFRMYYGLRTGEDPFDVTQIAAAGPTGSHSLIKVNHYYSLGQALVTMATTNRPDWVAVPANEDAESLQDKILAQQLLDYYMRETGLELVIRQAVESAVVMQDGYVLLTWDPGAGREVTPEIPPSEAQINPETDEEIPAEEGAPATYAGDVRVASLTPFDVALDLDWRGSGERPWVITREFVNKWDLAAQYPEYADDIENAWYNPAAEGLEPAYMAGTSFGEDFRFNKDQVAVFTFWHRKTKAVPQGKMVRIVNDKCCLFNGGLPYGDHLPLHRVAPAVMAGSTFGHSPQINLIAVQKAISAAWSAPVTNLSLYGAGALLVPKGAGLNVSDMGGGAFAMEYDPTGGKPEPLNVPGLQQPAIEMAKELVRTAEVISGVAPVVRGNASPQLSGAAQALQMQTATQYVSGLIQGYTKLLESTGDALVKILQTYAMAPKLALIVGLNKAPMLKEFTGKDIQNIARVTVESGNPVSKTPAGMMTIADNLLEKQMITAQQYIAVRNTGTLDPVFTSPSTQQALIKRENELLASVRPATPEEIQGGLATQIPVNGIPTWLFNVPPVLGTDNHPWHKPEHASVLDSLSVRKNPYVIAAVQWHLGEHEGFEMVPNNGIQPVPPPNMDPNPPPPLPGTPPSANGGGPGPDGNAPPAKMKQPGPGGPMGPNLPHLPKPATPPGQGGAPPQ